MGDIEKLRQAREAMSELFPLTPAMWQEWAKDEASLGTGYHPFHFYFPLGTTFAFGNYIFACSMVLLLWEEVRKI
jgi:hypothetical protein